MEAKDMRVGMKVRARRDCCNDLTGGEGTIETIDGVECTIRLTKRAKLDKYTIGAITNQTSWHQYIEPVGKFTTPTHIITWDTRDIDPFCVVYGNKEKATKIKELLADDVIKDSIRVYSVKDIQKVEYSYKLKQVK